MSRLAVILTIGSRGDVEPCVALGRGLRAAGWSVRLGALAPFRADTVAAGLDFALLGDLPERFARHRGPTFSGLPGRVLFWSVYQRLLGDSLPRFVEACRGAQLIVYTGLAFPAYHVAEAMQVPCASVAFVPGVPTTDFLNPLYVDQVLSRGPMINRATFFAEQSLMMQTTAHHINTWRRRVLGLKPVRRRDLIHHRWDTTSAMLLGFSEAVVPRPNDWGDRVHVPGYFVLEAPEARPDPALEAFLEGGPAPVYVGFGSMTNEDGSRLAREVIESLQNLGLRGVLARGWGGLTVDAGKVPLHVHVVDAIPHQWLFERVRAAVHHGGAGTTAAALRAGIPSVIVPFNYDQRFWGVLLHERGLGPPPIPPRQMRAERLSAALRLVAIASYAERIQPLADRLKREDGVSAAVAILSRLAPERSA